MWVVKLGGSLAHNDALRGWLDVLGSYGAGNVVIVPGGGPFADQVRDAQDRWQFSDRIAHRMALLAMEQYGLMLLGMRRDLVPVSSLNELRTAAESARVSVWLPAAMAIEESSLPATWDLTSDSLAAWLARLIRAERLVLVKAVTFDGAPVACSLACDRAWVDRAFPQYLKDGGFSAWLCGPEDCHLFQRALYGGAMAGSALLTDGAPEAGSTRRGADWNDPEATAPDAAAE